MYWTDRRLEKVFEATSKPNQSSLLLSPTTMIGDMPELSDLAAFDQLAQPKSSSPCHISESLRKSPCPQLCFAVPGSSAPNCACAKGVPKGRICEEPDVFLYLSFNLSHESILIDIYDVHRWRPDCGRNCCAGYQSSKSTSRGISGKFYNM
jgi:hypothetical protein